jgi:exodeoxyribonuclease VII small subunit
METKGDPMDFEKKLGRLEEIVQKMEKGDSSLEDNLKLFEEGIKLSRECHTRLNEAEAKVKKLVAMDASGKATLQDFAVEDE